MISPIGEDKSPTRALADKLLVSVIGPALKKCGYAAVRADQIGTPGDISDQVIQHLRDAPLAIAVLHESNANVYYEMAVRHTLAKPLVPLAPAGAKLPFDVAGIRTVFVDTTKTASVERAKRDITAQIKGFEKDPKIVLNPVTRVTATGFRPGLVASPDDLIRVNIEIVSQAEQVFFATGSRSRDVSYLRRIERRLRLRPKLVHYRVLFGPPFREVLKQHLLRLLKIRNPAARSRGFKTLYMGMFDKPQKQAEVFIAGNEKRVLVVLPSRKGLGEYNTALLIDDTTYVNDMLNFVKQLYEGSELIETREAVKALRPVMA